MTTAIDLDAAALQRLTRRDVLAALLDAKARSDRRDYAGKSAILRQLLKSNADEFYVDSDDGHGIVGLTHAPLGFRIHLPQDQLTGLSIERRIKQADGDPAWDVTRHIDDLLEDHGDRIFLLKDACRHLAGRFDAWYLPDSVTVQLSASCPAQLPNRALDAAAYVLEKLAGVTIRSLDVSTDLSAVGFRDRPSVATNEPIVRIKQAYSPTLRGITDVLALTEGPANAWYGGPRPIASMLVGGLAGASLGYLGGALGENLVGDSLQKGRLRRTLALLGAAGGATPGLVWGLHSPKGFFSSWPHGVKTGALSLRKLLPDCVPATEFVKAGTMGGFEPTSPIDVDRFAQTVWSLEDPWTPAGLRAGALGLVESASTLRGNSPWVSPYDVSRIAMGMGSGALSARLVGRTLGALAGLSPDAQQALQRAGTWAGLMKTVVPLAFSGT